MFNPFKKKKPAPVWTPEPIEADPVAHALEQLDSDVRLGKVSVEERVAILNAMLAPRLDRIEEALHHE